MSDKIQIKMKNLIPSFFALILLLSCKNDKSKDNFELTGNIKGFKSGKLFIQRLVDTNLVVIDSIIIDGNSEFSSSFELKSPEMLYLFIDRGVTNSLDNNLQFFAEPGKMNIDTDLELFFMKAKITGSKNQRSFEEFVKVNREFNNQILELTAAKFKVFKNKASSDSIVTLQNDIVKRKYLFALNFAINNNDLEVAPFIALTEINDINLKYLNMIQKSMTPNVAKSLYGKKLIALYKERNKSEQSISK